MINKKAINVLFIESNTDGTTGGSHFSLFYLIKNLNKIDFHPIIVVYEKNRLFEKFQENAKKIFKVKKHKPINLKCISFEGKLKSKFANNILDCLLGIVQKPYNFIYTFVYPTFYCYKILKDEDINIVHLNNTIMRPQEWILASLLAGVKVVAHERGINLKFDATIKYFARKLDAIFCISNAVMKNLVNNKFPKDRLHLVYNSIDVDDFIVDENRIITKNKLGLSEHDETIVLVGNIRAWKGQKVAILSMNNVLKEFSNAKLLLVGGYSEYDKGYYEDCINTVKREGLSHNVKFVGERKDVSNIINAADIMIHTSIEPEPFGRVIIEGMALKKPVITNSIGAGPELVVNEVTGLIVQPNDPQELADAIIMLLKDQEKCSRMGEEGRKRVLDKFNIKMQIDKIECIYRSVIQEN